VYDVMYNTERILAKEASFFICRTLGFSVAFAVNLPRAIGFA